MKKFDKLFSKCTLKVVETRDMPGMDTNFSVKSPHK